MGAVLQQLFGKDWQSLQPTITPDRAELSARQQAVAALQRCLKSGTAQLVGSAAAGLALPGCDADIVVLLPGLTAANHAAELAAVAAAVKSAEGQKEGFSNVLQGEFSVQCNRAGINIDVLVGSEQPPGILYFLDSSLTYKQRQCLSASTAAATTAFLSYQPPLFKHAVRLVKHWAKQLHGKDWNDQQRNRPKSYLLVLLTLKAYQQHITAAAAANNASAAAAPGSSHDEAAALGCILQHFLRLAAQLSSSSVFSWEVQYSSDTVQQVLARPDLAAVLRPKGCEGHPIILDPACPTNNVAAAVADLSRLQQLAAADLARVEGSRIAMLEQKLQEQQSALQKVQLMQNAIVQQQATQLAALLLHQRILVAGPRSGTVSWEFTMPVSAWLVSSGSQVVAGPVQTVSGLYLQIISLPYSKTAYGDALVGIEVQLATDSKPELRTVAELDLPIPFQVLARGAGYNNSGTTISLQPETSGYYQSGSEVQLDGDCAGTLAGSAGVRVMLSCQKLRSLYLTGSYSDDVRSLEEKKHRTVKFSLKFKVAAT